ncbi:hypothetical protein CL630_03135 [bacterium]|nr:hypothetical protein [bacterium]|tara:strand:- start:9845 stop:11773 length:1929 start_codon:yes stop_codon:yes gene_type:complete
MSKVKKEGKIERLKKSLYRRGANLPPSERFELHTHDGEGESGWEAEEADPADAKKPIMPFWKKFFIISILFFVLAMIVASFVLLRDSNVISTKNVDILVSGPVAAPAGEEVQLQIVIENNNSVPLEFVDFLVEYPQGTRSVGKLKTELSNFRKSLDRIEAGEVIEEPLRLVLFGQEGDEKKFNITLEYRVEDSNAIFVKEKEHEIHISSSATSLTVETLSEAVAGQEFEIKATVISNTDIITRDLAVEIDYPFGFSFLGAEPQAVSGDNKWLIGDLAPRARRVIVVRGILEGQDGEEKVFRVSSGAKSKEKENELGVTYNTSISTISIARPFLSTLLFVNGETRKEPAVGSGSLVDVEVVWTNNLPTKIVDARIEAKLSGDVINELSVKPRNGFFDSADNTILWDKNSLPDLADIESGAQGRTSFRFALQPLFTTSGSLFKNPTVDIVVTTSGKRLSESGVDERVENSIERTIKIASDVVFTSRMVYFVGPFINTGPVPPEVERETTYTVVFTAVNSSNHVSRSMVKAVLPPYVKWVGVFTPMSENISYNESSREVVWNIDRLEAGSGMTLPPREVAFQVKLMPSLSHLNQTPTVIGESTFSGVDEFTETVARLSSKALDTSLSTDPNFIFSQGKVVLPKDE